MLRHVALFKLKPGVTDAEVGAVVDGLRALPDQVPSIRGYEVGRDLDLNEGTYDLAVVALFDDEDGYVQYLEHPAHRKVADELLAPIRIDRSVVQFEQ
jgi:hypothetical protein